MTVAEGRGVKPPSVAGSALRHAFPAPAGGHTPFESPGRGFNLLNNYTAVEGVYPAAAIRVPLRAMQADSKRANAKTYACPLTRFPLPPLPRRPLQTSCLKAMAYEFTLCRLKCCLEGSMSKHSLNKELR